MILVAPAPYAPFTDRRTEGPPGLSPLAAALLAYGPRSAPGVTVTVTSTLPVAPAPSASIPVSRSASADPSKAGFTVKSVLATASTT